MKILALEASAAAASCALLEDDRLLGENFLNLPQTHSQTLMPMAQRLLETAGVSAREMDLIAVSAGPGSFTGLRIAMAAAKGMAFPGDTPCAGVSTLEALAYNLPALEGAVLPAMDARCGQVYAAMFDLAEGRPRRLIADSALAVRDLEPWLQNLTKPVFLVGDGAQLCYNILLKDYPFLKLAPAHLRFQRAASVGLLALREARAGRTVSARELVPSYLRLPQAERELLQKQAKQQKK